MNGRGLEYECLLKHKCAVFFFLTESVQYLEAYEEKSG